MGTAQSTLSWLSPFGDSPNAATDRSNLDLSAALRTLGRAVAATHERLAAEHPTEVQRAREAYAALEAPARSELVNLLREQVQTGTYVTDAHRVAEKMIPRPARHSPGAVCSGPARPRSRAAALGALLAGALLTDLSAWVAGHLAAPRFDPPLDGEQS